MRTALVRLNSVRLLLLGGVTGFSQSTSKMTALSSSTPGPLEVADNSAPCSGTSDALFAVIERMQLKLRPPGMAAPGALSADPSAEAPPAETCDPKTASWGRFLDAGTGAHSLSWVQQLPLASWAAVTADKQMKRTVENEAARDTTGKRPENSKGNIVLGNWDDEKLLAGEQYEVVLADYLIGAMDGFSPFKQDLIFDRLRRHVAPNSGILYIIGLQPIPYSASYPEDIIVDVTRARDACILLAGHRCYREYPLTWVQRQLTAHGYRVLDTETLPILYSEQSIRRQINVAKSKLPHFKDRTLAQAMEKSLAELDRRMVNVVAAQKPTSRIRHGFDYIIAAELDPDWTPPADGGRS